MRPCRTRVVDSSKAGVESLAKLRLNDLYKHHVKHIVVMIEMPRYDDSSLCGKVKFLLGH